jgi:hypothetical protein
VNEREWLAPRKTYAPDRMLAYLRQRGVPRLPKGRRKLHLLACACCRWVWDQLGAEHRRAVEAAERFADGRIGPDGLASAAAVAREAGADADAYSDWSAAQAAVRSAHPTAAEAVRQALFHSFNARARDPHTPGALDKARWAETEAFQCGLFRDLFGNPFWPPPALDPAWLVWNDAAVRRLAVAVYDERAFDRSPILADALEEAGCTDDEILGHLRGAGPHVRGCWAVDLLLGKS